MQKTPNVVKPGTDVPFDSERREGEVYARMARVQLSFWSFMRLACWLAVGLGVARACISLLSAENFDMRAVAQSVGFFVFGFIEVFAAGLLVFPVYWWVCEKRGGLLMQGKFSAIIPLDTLHSVEDERS